MINLISHSFTKHCHSRFVLLVCAALLACYMKVLTVGAPWLPLIILRGADWGIIKGDTVEQVESHKYPGVVMDINCGAVCTFKETVWFSYWQNGSHSLIVLLLDWLYRMGESHCPRLVQWLGHFQMPSSGLRFSLHKCRTNHFNTRWWSLFSRGLCWTLKPQSQFDFMLVCHTCSLMWLYGYLWFAN